MSIIKSDAAIEVIREGGKILAECLYQVTDAVAPGVTTNQLDALFLEAIKKYGATPSFLGYQEYPKSICTSINNEVVHGIPTDRVLQEGDIIGVDCGIWYNKYCTDMARTVPVGTISQELQQLIDVTAQALQSGIAQLHPGNTLGDVGAAIQAHADEHGYGVVHALVGHGVGDAVHEDPAVPNHGVAGTGQKIQSGMVLAIEPMFTLGTAEVDFDEQDGWTVRTRDHSFAAHHEDTVAVRESGPEILTSL